MVSDVISMKWLVWRGWWSLEEGRLRNGWCARGGVDKRSETWSVISGETREVEPGRESSVEEVVWMAGVERIVMTEYVEPGGGSSGESGN